MDLGPKGEKMATEVIFHLLSHFPGIFVPGRFPTCKWPLPSQHYSQLGCGRAETQPVANGVESDATILEMSLSGSAQGSLARKEQA